MKKIIMLSCFLVLMPLSILAATINVPGGQATIQAGIDVAVDGDVVLLANGTYSGAGNYNIDFKGKSLTVKSANGPDNCIVDCQQLGRAFSGEASITVTLEGLTIKNGTSGLNSNGGAVVASKLIVNDCIFENNQASQDGGAVYSTSSAVFKECRFIANKSAYHGGAVKAFTATVENCVFKENSSSYDGGAVYCVFFSFAKCIFTNNRAVARGGAIFLGSRNSSQLTGELTNCIFSGNQVSSGSGGAVYVYIFDSDTNYHSYFINCTFTQNHASKHGGAVSCALSPSLNDSINFKNCIIWDNVASEGEEIEASLGDGSPVITYSDVKGGYTGAGNIDFDPLFLAIEEKREFYLYPDSPCIDSGTDVGAPGEDIDGIIRPVGTIDDMGAYEYQNDVFIWEGQNYDWHSVNNWNSTTVPGLNDLVIISSQIATADPEINSGVENIGKLFINSGALSITQGELSIGGS